MSLSSKPSAELVSKAREFLESDSIACEVKPDGTLYVPGDLNISRLNLEELPDLSFVVVKGYFNCNENRLTSLKGAPRIVGGNFSCADNQLTSLDYVPSVVNGFFNCSGNRLSSLKGAPRSAVVGFFCQGNQLRSLEHAPTNVGGRFWCQHNPLTSLEHAAQNFTELKSDFGDFKAWNDVPEQLRVCAETKAQREREFVESATVLQRALIGRKPYQFKMHR